MESSMVKILIGGLFMFFLFTQCKEEKREYALSDEKMQALLLDIHTSEAALQSVFGRRKDSLRLVYMQYIYKIHEMDSLSVNRLLNKLREDPEKIEVIYQQMLDKMVSVPD